MSADPIAIQIADAVVERLKSGEVIQPRILSLESTATYIGRSPDAVRKLAAQGAFPRVETDRRLMFDREDLDAWIERNKVVG